MSDNRIFQDRTLKYIMRALERELEASKKKAKSARGAGDRVTSIFNEGRIAGLISAGKIIKGEL